MEISLTPTALHGNVVKVAGISQTLGGGTATGLAPFFIFSGILPDLTLDLGYIKSHQKRAEKFTKNRYYAIKMWTNTQRSQIILSEPP